MRIAVLPTLLLSIGALACARPQAPARQVFAVEGRTNAQVSLAARGDVVAAVWSASGEAGTDIYSAVSENGGTRFSAPVRVNDIAGDANPSGEQPARLAIGPTAIHIVWPSKRGGAGIRYASSTDGGRTFSPAISVPEAGLRGARGWESVSVDDRGAVHLVWLDGRAAVVDAQAAESGHRAAMHEHGAQRRAIRQDIYHATWTTAGAITETPVAANVCFCCKTAVTASNGRVHAAWRHIYGDNIRDIAYARSDDAGATFGEPVRVSSDAWQIEGCPDDGPAMTVIAETVRIVWPTLVPGPTPRKGIFYATSTGGGQFSARVQIDAGTADPAHPQIATAPDGSTLVVWDETADGTRHVRSRRIASDGTVGPIDTIATGLYPVVVSTSHGMLAAWTSATRIEVAHLP